jgi:hypothetical protein
MKDVNRLIDTNMLEWRVNTPAFLKEAFENMPGTNNGVWFQPVNIFRELLVEVAKRASQLNDPVMNALMCRLCLYAESDPYDKDYKEEVVKSILASKEYFLFKINKTQTQ